MKLNVTGGEVMVLTFAVFDLSNATTLQEVTDVEVKNDPINEHSPD